MTKRELSAILAKASAEEVAVLAEPIKAKAQIQVLKEPQKTLVMVKVREAIKNSLFYLGEVLATECMVTVNGVKGMSVIAGDQFDKAINIAVIDGYLNGNASSADILEQIAALGISQQQARQHMNRQIRKSKVNFNVMGE